MIRSAHFSPGLAQNQLFDICSRLAFPQHQQLDNVYQLMFKCFDEVTCPARDGCLGGAVVQDK